MDEIEFKRSMNNLKVLIDAVAHVDARNALLVIMHLISGLNDRITEMQMEEDDE
jgi:hypothetical protein